MCFTVVKMAFVFLRGLSLQSIQTLKRVLMPIWVRDHHFKHVQFRQLSLIKASKLTSSTEHFYNVSSVALSMTLLHGWHNAGWLSKWQTVSLLPGDRRVYSRWDSPNTNHTALLVLFKLEYTSSYYVYFLRKFWTFL